MSLLPTLTLFLTSLVLELASAYTKDVMSLLDSLGFKNALSIGWGFGGVAASNLMNATDVNSEISKLGMALIQPTPPSNIARRNRPPNLLDYFASVAGSLAPIMDLIAALNLSVASIPPLIPDHVASLASVKLSNPDHLLVYNHDLKRVLRHTLHR